MDNVEKQYEDFISNINFDDEPDAGHRDKLEQYLLAAMNTPSRQTEQSLRIWRIIMKSKITKLATAAVIIMAAIYGLTTILDRSATPAYAVEQTIEAFRNVSSVYYVMHFAGYSTETWARRGRDGKFWMGDYRMQSTGGMTVVANESKDVTYKYNDIEKILHIYRGITDTTGGWLDVDFYELLRDEMEHVSITQIKDKHSGKDCISITFKVPEKYKGAGRSGVILFDIESKLPARMTMWSNDNFDDEPLFEITKIIYNLEISEEIFDFEVPEGATVIEQEQD